MNSSDVVVVNVAVVEWLLPIQDDDVGLWVVEPNDDKMRKDSDMMQVDVVHCSQIEKEVAILEVEEEVCSAQLPVDEEEERSEGVEASDHALMLPRCLSSRLVVIAASLMTLLVEAVSRRDVVISSLLMALLVEAASRRSVVISSL